MHIFYIPSWFPHEGSPLSGIFIAEQIEQMRAYFPNYSYTTSLCGIGQYSLSFRHPLRAYSNFRRFYADQPAELLNLPRNATLYQPCMNWSERLIGGNIKGLLAGHEKNLLRALHLQPSAQTLIHAHVSYPGGWVAMHLAHKYALPYLITEHMSPFPLPKRAFARRGQVTALIADPLRHAHHVVAVSPVLAEQMQAKVGCIKALSVLPNGLSEHWSEPPMNASKNDPHFHFFCLALISPQKGIDTLLRAFQRAYQHSQHLRLTIGGDGAYLLEYQRLAKELGLDAAVTWLGHVPRDQVRERMLQADAFILTSRHESLGMVYIEAMACGLPLIATRCGGPESFITDTVGRLVEIDHIPEIAEVMLKTAQGDYNYNSVLIRQRFQEQFSASAVTRQLDSIYQRVLA